MTDGVGNVVGGYFAVIVGFYCKRGVDAGKLLDRQKSWIDQRFRSKEILKLIEDVNKKYGNTIIMVTHNEAIKNMADHVIKLRDGAVRHNERNTNKISAADLEW